MWICLSEDEWNAAVTENELNLICESRQQKVWHQFFAVYKLLKSNK